MQQQDNHEYPFLYQRQTCHQVQPNQATYQKRQRSEERFSRNAETDLVCRLLLEKKNKLVSRGACFSGGVRSTIPVVSYTLCSSAYVLSFYFGVSKFRV